MSPKVPGIKLNDGREMPIIGLGTYDARESDPGQYRQAVEWALELGYRHIDTASIYNNEEEVGQGINEKIKNGTVKREELFVATKLWNDKHAKADVLPALKESLKRLQLDYVDLYLVHWPLSINSKGEDTKIDFLETWQGMEECLKSGLARSIGVSNFNEHQLQRLIDSCNVKPVCNQIEISPTLTQVALSNFCLKNSIVPVAYTPLGLISEARPEFNGKDVIKTDPKLGEIADKYGKSRAQIALRYLIQRGIPVIPKSFTKTRIQENLSIFDFELTEAEIETINNYNIDFRCVPVTAWTKFTYFPF